MRDTQAGLEKRRNEHEAASTPEGPTDRIRDHHPVCRFWCTRRTPKWVYFLNSLLFPSPCALCFLAPTPNLSSLRLLSHSLETLRTRPPQDQTPQDQAALGPGSLARTSPSASTLGQMGSPFPNLCHLPLQTSPHSQDQAPGAKGRCPHPPFDAKISPLPKLSALLLQTS